MMKKLYHVTTKAHWEKIRRKGLKPDIGLMSGYVADLIWKAETKKAVYMFTKIGDENFWYFVDYWMDKMYGKENLVLLEVKLPKTIRKMDRSVEKEVKRIKRHMKFMGCTGYFPEEAFYNYEIRDKTEFVCYKKIPSKYIKQIPFPGKKADEDEV